MSSSAASDVFKVQVQRGGESGDAPLVADNLAAAGDRGGGAVELHLAQEDWAGAGLNAGGGPVDDAGGVLGGLPGRLFPPGRFALDCA